MKISKHNFLMSNLQIALIFFALFITKVVFSQNLFTDAQDIQLSHNQASILNRYENEPTTIELKVVEVNKSFLKKNIPVKLNLFPDEIYSAFRMNLEKRSDDDFTWYGNVPGKQSNIVISTYRDAVVGFFVIDDKFFNLRTLGMGLNVIIRVNPNKYPECGNIMDLSQELHGYEGRSGIPDYPSNINLSKSDEDRQSSASGTIIKALVAYTTNAKNAEGGESAINALIDNACAATNQSYDSSSVSIDLQVAHTFEVSDYTETGQTTSRNFRWCNQSTDEFSVVLRDLQDGTINQVHELRDAYAADIVVLITDSSIPDCGQAFEIGGNADEAFCIVRHNCAAAAGQWSFAHEIGHLQAARHQIEFIGDDCEEPEANAHGYILPGSQWMTMMAVWEGATRIQFWSNPDINHPVYGVLGDDDVLHKC